MRKQIYKSCNFTNTIGRLFLMLIIGIILSPNTIKAQGGKGSNSLHFRPSNTKAGDVIPFYHKGSYHIFYMRDSNWGHIVSRDLVHWKILPDALSKGTDPLGPDGEGCWTGSVVESNGVFYLFYTGKNSLDPKGDQKVMMATSTDLINWKKEPRHTFYADGNIYWNKTLNGPIDDKLNYHHQAFRDPDVFWNSEEKEWWMLLHTVLPDGSSPAMGLYSSKDIINWKPEKPLLVYPAEISGDCPFLFNSNGKWFMNFADYHYKFAEQLEGPYDSPVKQFDSGDLRVPKVMWDGRRYVIIGWILDYEGESDSGEPSWGGPLCMPRELWTDSQGNQFQRPLPEILAHFESVEKRSSGRFAKEERMKIPNDFMFHAKVQSKSENTKVTVQFPHDKKKTEGDYHLKVDFRTKEIELGSRYKSYKRICDFDPEQPLDIRIFMVGDVLECFINDAYSFTMRVYGERKGDLSITAQGDAIKVITSEVFKPVSQPEL